MRYVRSVAVLLFLFLITNSLLYYLQSKIIQKSTQANLTNAETFTKVKPIGIQRHPNLWIRLYSGYDDVDIMVTYDRKILFISEPAKEILYEANLSDAEYTTLVKFVGMIADKSEGMLSR